MAVMAALLSVAIVIGGNDVDRIRTQGRDFCVEAVRHHIDTRVQERCGEDSRLEQNEQGILVGGLYYEIEEMRILREASSDEVQSGVAVQLVLGSDPLDALLSYVWVSRTTMGAGPVARAGAAGAVGDLRVRQIPGRAVGSGDGLLAAPDIQAIITKYEWDAGTISRIISCESTYIPMAMNPSGARGYLQIMPVHVDKLERVTGSRDLDLLFVPEINIAVGWLVYVDGGGLGPWVSSIECWGVLE